MTTVLIDYGAGNTKSVENALKKIGVDSVLTNDPKEILDAESVILPGVGNFGSAMERLAPLKQTIQDYVETDRPFLGVCLGIQIIFDSSPEAGGVPGLGLLPGTCGKFSSEKQKVPHMGWNTLEIVRDTPILEGIEDGDFFYFVHSYFAKPEVGGVIAAKTGYGVEFPSVVAKDNVFATQFHPEKSGEKGLEILKNFTLIGKK